MTKLIDASKEYLTKLLKKEVLFVQEENLVNIPWDYQDAIMYMFTHGFRKQEYDNPSFILMMDDPQSSQLFRLLAKKQIEVYVLTERKVKGKNVLWNMLLTKEKVDGHPDPKKLFIGGENLRKYCDKNNVFYKSAQTSKGTLISASNLLWLKKEGEDCRKALNI